MIYLFHVLCNNIILCYNTYTTLNTVIHFLLTTIFHYNTHDTLRSLIILVLVGSFVQLWCFSPSENGYFNVSLDLNCFGTWRVIFFMKPWNANLESNSWMIHLVIVVLIVLKLVRFFLLLFLRRIVFKKSSLHVDIQNQYDILFISFIHFSFFFYRNLFDPNVWCRVPLHVRVSRQCC